MLPRLTGRGRSVFSGDVDRQVDLDVAVQVQLDVVLADEADRPSRQTHFTALDLDAGLGQGLGDVGGADGAEELALGARLRAQLELEILELPCARARTRQRVRRGLLQLRPAFLDRTRGSDPDMPRTARLRAPGR